MSCYYNTKIISSGNRLEIYHYSLNQEYGNVGKNRKGRKKLERNKENMQKIDKNRREVLNRARNKIIRLVNCNADLTTFISLTYKNNMQDTQQSKKDLANCIKMLQKEFDNFKYLYVLEYQSRGAIHYHMLCNLPITVKTAKSNHLKSQDQKDLENYFHEVFWEHGWVDIRDLSQEGNTNVGLYVSVYLVEDLYKLDLQGAKCYGYSRNLLQPKTSVMRLETTTESIINDFKDNYDLTYMSSYNLVKDLGNEIRYGTANYMDMYRKQ